MSSRIPLTLLHAIARFWGRVLYTVPNGVRATTLKNLEHCLPDVSGSQQKELLLRSLQHTACTAMELGKSWWLPAPRTLAMVSEREGMDLFENAISAGKGVILLVPHMGNWELLGLAMGHERKSTWLYQPPKLAALDELMTKVRERSSLTMVPTSNRGVGVLLQALKKGEIVGILPDQVPGRDSGVYAPFFGKQAFTMTLVSKLLQRTGARVLCGIALRLPGSTGFRTMVFEADPEIYDDNLSVSLAALNRTVEHCIALAPEQYQWEYRRFRRQPDGSKIYQSG